MGNGYTDLKLLELMMTNDPYSLPIIPEPESVVNHWSKKLQ